MESITVDTLRIVGANVVTSSSPQSMFTRRYVEKCLVGAFSAFRPAQLVEHSTELPVLLPRTSIRHLGPGVLSASTPPMTSEVFSYTEFPFNTHRCPTLCSPTVRYVSFSMRCRHAFVSALLSYTHMSHVSILQAGEGKECYMMTGRQKTVTKKRTDGVR